MSRAPAPHSRIGWIKWRRLREPSVFWLPYFFSSPGDCTTFTRDHSASSSSATALAARPPGVARAGTPHRRAGAGAGTHLGPVRDDGYKAARIDRYEDVWVA